MTTIDTTQETTCRLFEIVEDGVIFEPLKKVNQIAGKYLQFEYHDDREDGTFPRVSDYTRLINRMDQGGTAEYLTWISSKQSGKLISDTGYCKVVRESKHDDKATLYFKNPIKIVVDYINDEPVMIEANCIEGEFTHEWLWMKNGRQDKLANGFEIYFDCKKIQVGINLV